PGLRIPLRTFAVAAAVRGQQDLGREAAGLLEEHPDRLEIEVLEALELGHCVVAEGGELEHHVVDGRAVVLHGLEGATATKAARARVVWLRNAVWPRVGRRVQREAAQGVL